jgi:hypothetical protein
LKEHAQNCIAELVLRLAEVGISDSEDRKGRKAVVQAQRTHHGMYRNVKHMLMITCVFAAGESPTHPAVTSQNSAPIREKFKKHDQSDTLWRGIQEHLTNFGFKRFEHPPYSPDLALYDFFSFGARKEHFSGQRLDSPDGLFDAVESFLGGLCADVLQTIFQKWTHHLRLYSESGGECVERTLQNYIVTFAITSADDDGKGQYRTPSHNNDFQDERRYHKRRISMPERSLIE